MIAYDRLKTTNNESEPTSALQIAIAGAIIALLNVCPFAFCAIGVKYRTRLDESDVKKKFGTLYNGLKAKNNQAIGYSIVFLVRRSLFVAITFSLFGKPSIQIHAMIILTLLQISYIGFSDLHETGNSRRLELTNEFFFIVISYNFLLLSGLAAHDYAIRNMIGEFIIVQLSYLLVLNLLVILQASLSSLFQKCYLKMLKRARMKRWETVKQKRLRDL